MHVILKQQKRNFDPIIVYCCMGPRVRRLSNIKPTVDQRIVMLSIFNLCLTLSDLKRQNLTSRSQI